ncbi:MAG TPA: TIGR03557 family F420-dependent LLM class oxidoreductase [Egibacteraceae bacterium]|nr:TIGR03557 family F420-dependent LLM class oxidoreductase [Egibacteraceae bacterium]
MQLGYWLSSEEHPPADLVRWARRAEEAGFSSAAISDHYHPWTARQGQAPFVWTVLGTIASATQRLSIGTAVTAPMIRLHPAVVAHAAATAACLLPGRFFLGVGSGERLNEHILGTHWPEPRVRLEMLEEAVAIIRRLFDGEMVSHHGAHFTVETARLFTRPESPPPIYLAAGGRRSAEVAARIGDGLIGVAPNPRHVEAFEAAGGRGKPRLGQVHVCWADTEADARRIAHEWWPNGALSGPLLTELPQPRDVEQAARLVRLEDVARVVACGPDPEVHLAAIARFAAAGFSVLYVHQVGPDQEGFFRFYERDVLPALTIASPTSRGGAPT